MAFSDFTVPLIKQKFGITINESGDLFSGVREVKFPPTLSDTLARYLPLALNLNTEKARSELLIAPMLIEFKLQHRDRVSLFSGIEFSIEEGSGLKGRCDFILARNPEQLALTSPICVLVEAKSENIVGGIGQCLAEMIAAQRFNREAAEPESAMYGAVTTGVLWRFLKLEGKAATIDSVEYPIQNAPRIYAILSQIVLGPDSGRAPSLNG